MIMNWCTFKLFWCLSLALQFIDLSHGRPDHGKNVICNIASWSVYMKEQAKFKMSYAEPALPMCTHLKYAYVGLDDITGRIKSLDPFADFTAGYGLGNLNQLVAFKEKYDHLKIMVSIGGYNEGSVKYSKMAANDFSRRIFIDSVIDYLTANSLDGLDIAWSCPGERGGSPNDKQNLVILAKELKKEFEQKNWILSITIPSNAEFMGIGFDLNALEEYVDFFNVETYEYHANHDGFVGPTAPLRSYDGEDVEHTLDILEKSGISLKKINLGITSIGVTYMMKNNVKNSEEIENIKGQPTMVESFVSEYLQIPTYISYGEICILESREGWKLKWDRVTSTPYLVNGNKVISFENPRSIKEKLSVTRAKKLGGVFFERLDTDDFYGDCRSTPINYPLLRTINEELLTWEREKDMDILSADSNEKRIVCYLAKWGVYLPGNGKFDIEEALHAMPICTHVVYNFFIVDENYNINTADAKRDLLENGGIARMVEYKKKFPHLKIMAGVGGWDEGSEKYSRMMNSMTKRHTFIFSAVNFLKLHNLDGLDLNWQFPGDRGGSHHDKQNLVIFAKEIREEFDMYNFTISFAVSCMPFRISLGLDPQLLSKYAHFLNILTYEYHGFWEQKVLPSSPLYAGEDDLNIEGTISIYEKLGTPPEKINLGLTSYALTYILWEKFNNSTIVGKPAKNVGFPGPYTAADGFIAYNEICLFLKDPSWFKFYDPQSATKFAVKDDRVISYDDEETIYEKVIFAMKKKLGGFIYYGLEKDDFRNDCGSGKYPLLNTVKTTIDEYPEYLELLNLFKKKKAKYFWTLGDDEKNDIQKIDWRQE